LFGPRENHQKVKQNNRNRAQSPEKCQRAALDLLWTHENAHREIVLPGKEPGDEGLQVGRAVDEVEEELVCLHLVRVGLVDYFYVSRVIDGLGAVVLLK
jgi:hypothetical protein